MTPVYLESVKWHLYREFMDSPGAFCRASAALKRVKPLSMEELALNDRIEKEKAKKEDAP